ncbi:hypothetical protein NCF86_03565 [Pelagerythrobacter marinus]|nr:hypothetical protein NCF86_03565 [Pelagerythrobacter marinus]
MKRIIVPIASALLLSACANSALTVETPDRSNYRSATAQVERDREMVVPVDAENLTYTQKKLEEELFGGDTPLFEQGDGLTVRYRYVGFNEGSRVGRYLTAGLTGGSKVVLEVDFVGPDGTVLSTVRGEGSVSGGMFGGSNKSGIDKAVKRVAEYAAMHYR